ncbi:arsenate reductase family protein [Terrilactibacillus laevilacticus]|uniref:Arsenate reductase family protein n=1 Tax=Terrilactibacillus laevilacticus TaxID=1380157 RepID=A0ABW5PT98_9BACI|nr:arsenate reductase family protein [Terrilactibacillus laevilacticus]
MITFYGYPKCGTSRKAKKWLDDREVEYRNVHIVDSPPSKEELKVYVERSGLPIKKFFNTSGKKYRGLGLKDKINEATQDELLSILASDGMLIKRPLVADENHVTVGFKEETFKHNWEKE